MDPRGLRVTKNAHFSLLTHTNQLLFVMFCDQTTGIGSVTKHDMTGQDKMGPRMEVIVEIVM